MVETLMTSLFKCMLVATQVSEASRLASFFDSGRVIEPNDADGGRTSFVQLYTLSTSDEQVQIGLASRRKVRV